MEEIEKIIQEARSNYMLDMEKTKPSKYYADKILDLINQRAEPQALTLGMDISNMERGLNALYLEIPESVGNDIYGRWKAILSHLPEPPK